MAGRVYLNVAYVLPRTILWVVLFAAALIDGIRHRSVRSRGCAPASPPPPGRAMRRRCCALQHIAAAPPCGGARNAWSAHLSLPSPPAPRSFQLYWSLVVCAGLFVLQELVLLILAAEAHGQYVNRATLGAWIFFTDLAASFWFGILLAVAAGFWWVLE